jgi:hypothetical protein
MSEDEARKASHEEAPDEVEAHGRAAANIEPDDESRRSENDDDVEAHGRMAGPDDARSAGRAV